MHRYQLPKTRRINHQQQPLVVVHSSSTPFVNNDWSVVCKPEQPKMKTYNDVLFVALTLGITMTGKDYTRITGERSVIQILSLILILILICKKSRGEKKEFDEVWSWFEDKTINWKQFVYFPTVLVLKKFYSLNWKRRLSSVHLSETNTHTFFLQYIGH